MVQIIPFIGFKLFKGDTANIYYTTMFLTAVLGMLDFRILEGPFVVVKKSNN